jgi:hypothetical protein
MNRIFFKAVYRPLIAAWLIFAAGLPASLAAEPAKPLCTIPVKLLADGKEPRLRKLWEKEYRDRLAAASAIIERSCGVRFEVVAVDTWTSSDDVHDFLGLMKEFEQKVPPAPGRLAIGFTGQFDGLQEDCRMGGANGPLRPHVLLREWGRQVSEAERLEMLVHELGHYLGAAHSAEKWSVMRPDLGDRQSRAKAFQIRFDEPNANAMRLVAEQLRDGRPASLARLPSGVKAQLRPLYQSLVKALPKDPAAARYLAMIQETAHLLEAPLARRQAAILAARQVVQAISIAAKENRALPEGKGAAAGRVRLDGDRLTELYIRAAAAAAGKLPRDVAREAFLLGIGVGLDDSPLPTNTPVLGDLWREMDPATERAERVAVLGSPTMRGRRDSTEHFAISAALTVLGGGDAALSAGIGKEISDAHGGSGFSFVDLSSDMAGIILANAVLEEKVALSQLEKEFAVTDFLPAPDGLREGLTWAEFTAAYGSPPGERWNREGEIIRARIVALPGYQGLGFRVQGAKMPR